MRHPFWRWTGWLSLGLAGCLHGQDWRAVVSKPTSRPVADRRESRPQPKVVGPVRGGQPKFVPPAEVATPAAIESRPAVARAVQAAPLSEQHKVPPKVKPELQTRRSEIIPVGLDVPKAAPSVTQSVVPPVAASASPANTSASVTSPPSSLVIERPRSEGFAEFERTIPTRQFDSVNRSVQPADAIEVVVTEKSEPDKATALSEKAPALPVITPAGALVPTKPVISPGSSSRTLEPEAAASEDRPRGLFSNSVPRAKELPDVTDTNTAPEKDPPSVDAEPAVRPQDVSVLVEQVFEDLRQRRLNDARQRTEWLKQLVKKRGPAGPAKEAEKAVSPDTGDARSDEPQHLQVDPQATAVEKMATDSFFDDEESTNCQ